MPPALDPYFQSPDNPLANRDQIECEARALALSKTERYARLREAIARRWRELAGNDPTEEAWSRFEALIDECAFAAVLKAVAGDPARPRVLRLVMPPHEWFGMQVPGSRFGGGPGTDQSYAIIPIDFGTNYRIHGQWIGVPPADHNYTMTANAHFMNAINTLQMDDVEADSDGRFVLTVGAKDGGRNHLQTFPGAEYLFVRDCRSDWRQNATALRVETTTPPVTEPWNDEQVMVRALQVGLDDAPNMFYWVRLFQSMPANTLTGPALTDNVGGLVSQTTAFARLVLGEDEAVVLTSNPAGAAFHDLQLNDWWFGALEDCIGRTASLTNAQMRENADGTVTCVVSRSDPGVHNWLDPNGLTEVLFVARWQRLPLKASPGLPSVTLAKVRLGELDMLLPASTPRVNASERAVQIAERRATYSLRLRT